MARFWVWVVTQNALHVLRTIDRHKYACEPGFASGPSHFIEMSETDAKPRAVCNSSHWGKESETQRWKGRDLCVCLKERFTLLPRPQRAWEDWRNTSQSGDACCNTRPGSSYLWPSVFLGRLHVDLFEPRHPDGTLTLTQVQGCGFL